MALCSTNKETRETRDPTRPAHPPRSVLAPSFSLCNSRRLGPMPRLEFPHDLRLGTSHRTPIRQWHVPALPFFALCNALSTASLLLCLPLADSPSSSPSPQASPPLQLPPASARPGHSLHMCQVPAETRRPSPPPSSPVLDMDAAAADDSPARPSPPWYHLTASPAANPPGSRLVTPSIGQKTSLSHLVNTTAPLSSSSPLAAPSLPNIRSYTRARGS